ncbi:ABC transporter substrate-binding protein [Rhodobaculum claviforme]|uniref:Diguanylate cyclase n=1 Tax=Rhodobaculum claviforme TaxID=1549854 RepID=A0A934TJF0_9RHOB|nr:ABC transporter substrate-binding protein [Rhodobaculum claviforme]MBK5926890.1 diguanylate cyclase [Rhodobaculum claviforme]
MSDPRIHPAARLHAREVAEGRLSRREFLTRATALGVSVPVAYGLLGVAAPRADTPARRMGGTLRIQQDVRALKDPRSFDWPQLSNFARGWLEYLVEYNRDGSFHPMLLEGWEVDDDAMGYTLRVRPGVTWNDGSPFTARDVAWNFTRWCDRSAEGNSMASRLTGLIDADTGAARDGAIEVVDDLTVRLNLSEPDISIIATCSDYTAAIVQDGDDGQDILRNPVGTGPYLPGDYEVGVRGVLLRNDDHDWWGTEIFGAPALERIEFIDLGTDQSATIAAADAGEIDMTYETVGDFIDLLDAVMERSETVTARTLVIRPNQLSEVDGTRPYADVRVRRALAMAVDNAVLLELGYDDRGVVAENHHVCPIHPEYAELPEPPVFDPAAARALMEEAGMGDFVHELISIDDSWRRPTADAAAAMLRDAGIPVERTVLPGATFWNDWQNYPFSTTDWGHRPLAVQSLALAYRSGEPWNESGFENAEFDALIAEALQIADADARREVMVRIQTLMQEEGVVIQPYWTSVFRHHVPGVVGAEAHPAFEIYPYKLGFAA